MIGFLRQGFSLCSPGCPGTHAVDQAGLKLRDSHLCLPSALHVYVHMYIHVYMYKEYMCMYVLIRVRLGSSKSLS